jgi:hypothetical protein
LNSPVLVRPRLTPRERSLRARIGAFALHSQHDARETTKNAREAFRSGFEREVDPDEKLDPAERERRARYARRAHYARLALKSARVRAQRAAARRAGEQANGA